MISQKASQVPNMAENPIDHKEVTNRNLADENPTAVEMTCTHCNQIQRTDVKPKVGSGTYIMCLILCIPGCCCLPFLMDKCKDQVHYCSNCQSQLGKYEYKACK
ncbi:LITAF-like zinc ribbon domain protein (macronuclear) [Tetrahymena thermophila SB210]|uniref:LITAF-like zinc ribbon domain protein n=1 Tax=Tetrahymena thermophila (strain SB210) TaxID=312017 RepID=Q23YW1_TETTS|nr:LITAF-like zinc ribbon domain protein [Tetrahymena thermophila SB210]EAS01694.1 LITAF-like zinc ribbon domain protein [Tetrahymena thermophila SB210]|eukprot:XP_001021939.1 LITAF-like zinc ribbon domain protein [Tetrahymena thermophila SB210]